LLVAISLEMPHGEDTPSASESYLKVKEPRSGMLRMRVLSPRSCVARAVFSPDED